MALIVHSILLWFFGISAVSVEISPFSFGFLFSPLLGESGQRFVNFFYPFKEPALGFIDFFSCCFFESLCY